MNNGKYPEFEEAVACAQRNGGGHSWGSPVAVEYQPGQAPLYQIDCQDCGMPVTATTLSGAMDIAQGFDRFDRALIESEVAAER